MESSSSPSPSPCFFSTNAATPSIQHPQYPDLDPTVSAAPFCTRRLPELQSLWRSFLYHHQQEKEEEETTNNKTHGHLRRRAKSHFRKRRHRFPRSVKEGNSTLHSHFHSNMNTNNNTNNNNNNNNNTNTNTNPPCRKAKRKKSNLRLIHGRWKDNPEQPTDVTEPWCITTKSTTTHEKTTLHNVSRTAHWLETHLWHTKRFHMSPPLFQIWDGWVVPLSHSNRDSKAILRWTRNSHPKCTVQDATWSMAGLAIRVQFPSRPIHHLSLLVPLLQAISSPDHISALFHDPDICSGDKMGSIMLHSLRRFPLGAICPATFFVQSHSLQILVPSRSLAQQIVSHIQQYIQEQDSTVILDPETPSHSHHLPPPPPPQNNPKVVQVQCTIDSGLSLLRVRGYMATSLIHRLFQPQPPTTLHPNMESLDPKTDPSLPTQHPIIHTTRDHNIWNDPKAHFHLSHGTILHASIWKNALLLSHDMENDMGSTPSPPPTCTCHPVLFLSQCPNTVLLDSKDTSFPPPSTTCNMGCSGWDILCPPSIASFLFHRLHFMGGACAIGLVEDTALRMEADPPLPIWPRDYPDTQDGMDFWSGTCQEWNLIRSCMDQGIQGGRFMTGLHRYARRIDSKKDTETIQQDRFVKDTESVDWSFLVHGYEPQNHEYETTSQDDTPDTKSRQHDVVVVRGSYGEPFSRAIQGLCVDYDNKDDRSKGNRCESTRRPRRPVQSQTFVTVPPLRKDFASHYKETCLALINNLSLPALIRCHVILEGKGTLRSKMKLCEYSYHLDMGDALQTKEESVIIGAVLSGMFSPSRGREHGIGMVSSKALLHYLAKGLRGTCVVHKGIKNQPKVYFRVLVTSNASDSHGRRAIAILLQ